MSLFRFKSTNIYIRSFEHVMWELNFRNLSIISIGCIRLIIEARSTNEIVAEMHFNINCQTKLADSPHSSLNIICVQKVHTTPFMKRSNYMYYAIKCFRTYNICILYENHLGENIDLSPDTYAINKLSMYVCMDVYTCMRINT